jgi:signal transduction histidine kinase
LVASNRLSGHNTLITPPAKYGGPPFFKSQFRAELCSAAGNYQMSEHESQIHAPNDETVRLRALVAEYENKIDEIAELVSRVRHEINNPLTGILGQAQLLLREELNEKARQRADKIEQLARRLAKTVAELRQVQKPARVSPPEAGE